MDDTFNNKVMYITGASSGIGYACAELFAQKGATVVITGRNSENLKNAYQQLLKISSKIIEHNIDVSIESEVIGSLQDIYKSCGQIDGLVYNARSFHVG